LSGARLPIDEVHEVFERRPNHFTSLEEEAEAFTSLLDPGDDLFGALKAWLRREHGIVVKVLPVATMPNWRRRYDRHSQRLFLSERLSPFDQLREVAMEASLIRMQVAVAAELQALKLTSDEARRLARFELGRYAAHALMMPYQAFHSAAQRARYDVDVLRSRFGVSFEQAANRLTMLQRQGTSAVPFFMLEVDNAGNRFRKAGAQGFPQSRFGGGCPKLPVHAAFTQPGQIFVEAVEMPDGAEFSASRVRWKDRRGLSASGHGARRSCSAATSPFATRSSMAPPCRQLPSAPSLGWWRPRRSARPAGCASARAACRAPNRRSPARLGSTRW
jgi:predicted transcriptional regulator